MLIHLDVDGTPPDVVLRGLFVNDTLILGRTTGLLAGKVDQSSRVGNDGTLVLDSVFVQLSDGGVALFQNEAISSVSERESGLREGSSKKRANLEVDFLHVETGFREHGEVLAKESVGGLVRAVDIETANVSVAVF